MQKRGFIAASVLFVIALVAALVAPVVATAGASGTAKSTIVLGDIGTDSGPAGPGLVAALYAAEAWVASTNAHGGLNGHPVKLVHGDDNLSVPTAISLATTMVQQDHITALFGLHSEVADGPVLNYLDGQHVPAVGDSSDPAPDETNAAMYSPIVDATPGNDDLLGLVKAVYPKNTKVGIIYCVESPQCLQQSVAMKAYASTAGVQIVYNAAATLTAPSYTAELLAAKAAGAQEIIGVEDQAAMLTMIGNAAQQNWYPPFELAEVSYSSLFKPGTLAPQDKILTYAFVPPWSVSSLEKPFVAAMKKYEPGKTIGDQGAAVWAAGVLLKEISPKFGATVTSADIVKDLLALKGTTLGGLTPPLTFPKGSDRSWVNPCVYAAEWSVSKSAWVATPLGANHLVCAKKT